jgi:hypothetical protein
MSEPKKPRAPRTTTSVYTRLNKIDVRPRVRKKGKVEYISWADAWHMLMTEFPDSTRQVYKDESTGLNFFTDGRTAYVEVGVTVKGTEHVVDLPVMDFRNNSIPIDKMNSFDVNKTVQRAMVKAIAMHGLGLQLWTKEDLYDADDKAPVKQEAAPAAAPAKHAAVDTNDPSAIVDATINYLKTLPNVTAKEKTSQSMINKYKDKLSEQDIEKIKKFVR